jgi:threonyl-tRNA synthetase
MAEGGSLRNRDEVVAEISSKFVILLPDGEEIQIGDTEKITPVLREYPSLANLVAVLKKGQQRQAPASSEAMQRLEWAAYEPASDKGHLRYYPKGTLVYNLLRDWHEQVLTTRMGACEIKTPLLYDWSEPDVSGEAGTFFDRLYYVYGYDKKREFVLKFGGDFGTFSMLKDTQMSYRQLPWRVFEYSNSFRYDRSGELRGLQRGRGFSFFDMHSVCANFEQGWQEYSDLYKYQADMAEELGIDYTVEFTVVESFFRSHKNHLLPLLQYSERPVLLVLLSKPKHYWAIKHVFYNEDTYKFFNVQLDSENSTRYNINYIDRDGKKQGCIFCHVSLGTMERWMFLVLEKALKQKEPAVPLWLSPTQVRLIPVNEEQVPASIKLAEQLSSQKNRVDVDDRQKSVGWRVHAAKSEWVPYIIVYGNEEQQSERLKAQLRGGETREFLIEELVQEIHQQTSHMPYRPLTPLRLSRRPKFN